MINYLLVILGFLSFSIAGAYEHGHDNSENMPKGDCGNNYLLPNKKARMGSHSFIVIGKADSSHLYLDHRSGTPPHNYQYILKVRVDEKEMQTYERLLGKTKIGLPAVTTIDFDINKKKVGRTFFCLQDLQNIFGNQKREGDQFEKLFPIRATWQVNADFEGPFKIGKSIVPSEPRLILERDDVELIVYRYQPSYLYQKAFRKHIAKRGGSGTTKLSHMPSKFNEIEESAKLNSSFFKTIQFHENHKFKCPPDYHLKNYRLPSTPHAFLVFKGEKEDQYFFGSLYEHSPLNYQTWFDVELSQKQSDMLKRTLAGQKSALFVTENRFCLAEIKTLIGNKEFKISGTIHSDYTLSPFSIGRKIGRISLNNDQIRLLTSRVLNSLIDPQLVAREVFDFVDIKTIVPDILVEARYNTSWNFIGQKIEGYRNNTCLLTKKAADQLALVQKDAKKMGYSLLIFDCYRPQRSVNYFVKWAKDLSNREMKSIFYPEVPKSKLVPEYIDDKSGHSRGSVVDLTLVKLGTRPEGSLFFKEDMTDCRVINNSQGRQIDMGTSFDCFSLNSHTVSNKVSPVALKNRSRLKTLMTKYGFVNYSKEWWHFMLKKEPYPKQYFNFEVY